ncbi:MAG TPA: nitroreductase family protein [Phycisphaerae bacterium]|nr:nitroreductase family protein [Phycisphaerae bacterium]
MDRREFLKSVPAMAALAAAASSLAEDLTPPSGAEAPAATTGPTIRLEPIQLVKPQTDGGKSVLAALWERKTTRGISDRKLPPQVLSDLLWSAFGVNRKNGPGGGIGRTAASASNSQEIDVYVAMAEGVYLYEAVPHRLKPVLEGDLRAKVGRGRRGAGATAPVRLIYVVDIARFARARFQEPGLRDAEIQKSYYFVDTGLIAGNVYLFAASQGLAAWFHNGDKPGLARALNLRPDQRVLFAQTVGYPG